jgi:MFS family permease
MDGLAVAILGVVMFYFMNENFGLGARDFSILYGVSQAIALSVLVPTGVLTEKYRRKPFIFWGTLISRYLTIVLAFSMVFPYGYLIAFALFAVKDAGLYAASPALKSLLADITPARIRGHMLGTVQKYSGIGFVIGSLLSGLTWDLAHQRIFDIFGVPLHGDSLVLLASSLIGIFPLYLILRYVWEPKRGR